MSRIFSSLTPLLFIFAASLAHALPSWVPMHPYDMKVVENSLIEAKFRLHLVNQARKSIDIITYDQRRDERVGQPLLEALRAAGERGVRVRFLRGSYSTYVFGKTIPEVFLGDSVERYFTKPPTKEPIQYILTGGISMILKGWSVFTGAHEKLVIIDGKVVLTTGRGQSANYLHWIDTCFIFKGELARLTQKTFNKIWAHTVRENSVHPESLRPKNRAAKNDPYILPRSIFKPKLHPGRVPEKAPGLWAFLTGGGGRDLPAVLTFSRKDGEKLFALKKWAAKPALAINAATLGSLEPLETRVLHNNFLGQVRKYCKWVPWFYNYDECSEEFHDAVVEETVNLVRQAKEIKIHTLALILPPIVKTALLDRLAESQTRDGRTFKLTVFTNGITAHRVVIPLPIGWYAGLHDLNDLIQAGAHIFAFVKNDQSPLTYLHRKITVAKMPDGNDVVIFGSHNMSYASTNANDETSFEVRNAAFGARIDRIVQNSIDLNGVELEPAKIANEQWWNTLPGWGWESSGWDFFIGMAQANF
jgi:hypothetical protein